MPYGQEVAPLWYISGPIILKYYRKLLHEISGHLEQVDFSAFFLVSRSRIPVSISFSLSDVPCIFREKGHMNCMIIGNNEQ